MGRISLFVLVIATAVVMTLPVAAQAGNLLTNADFAVKDGDNEQKAADWIESGAAGREVWSGRNSGEHGMAMRCWEGAGTGEAYQEVNAKWGAEYTFRIWACRDAGSVSGDFYIKLAWYSGEKLISEDIQKIVPTDAWAQYTITAKSPPTTDKVRVAFGSTSVTLTGKFAEAEFTGIMR